jgi:hypothetical protein
MYKQLIKRKLAYLIQSSDTSVINSPAMPMSYQRFEDTKEKEIIVWIRLLRGKDKQQIKGEITTKFNVSEQDAERLFYMAYPDGLDSIEEEYADYFEEVLPKENALQTVDDAVSSVQKGKEFKPLGINPELAEPFLAFMAQLLQSRKLV